METWPLYFGLGSGIPLGFGLLAIDRCCFELGMLAEKCPDDSN
jgi:hypothetical protein